MKINVFPILRSLTPSVQLRACWEFRALPPPRVLFTWSAAATRPTADVFRTQTGTPATGQAFNTSVGAQSGTGNERYITDLRTNRRTDSSGTKLTVTGSS